MVKKIIAKPHIFFFGLIPVFILFSFFSRNKFIDINIHDTYFVFEIYYFHLFSTFLFALIGFNYFSLYWAKKNSIKWLTTSHIILQIIAIIPFIFSMFHINKNNVFINNTFLGICDLNTALVISFFIFYAHLFYISSIFLQLFF